MATIQDIIRSVERQMCDIAGIRNIGRGVEQAAAIAHSAQENMAWIQASMERNRRFAEICIQLKWPPPWHISARGLDQITFAYQAGKLTADETAEIFSSYYTPARIDELGRRWEGYDWLSSRRPILQEALGNHIAGRHFSAVCVMLPQMEGVLTDYLGKKPKQSDITDVIRHSQLGSAACKFYTDIVMEHFSPTAKAAIPRLSRHAILHGKAVDYGTPIHSLRVILIADIILSSIEENRNRRPTDLLAAGA